MNATIVTPTKGMRTLLTLAELTDLARRWLTDHPDSEQCEGCGTHDTLAATYLIDGRFLCCDCAMAQGLGRYPRA
jgi:recombinational DNA repair protein (RecF pathway)